MKIAVAQAVCRLGMQLRGVMPSNGMGSGGSVAGSVRGQRSATAQGSLGGRCGAHRLTDSQCAAPVP